MRMENRKWARKLANKRVEIGPYSFVFIRGSNCMDSELID
jgi:hypothetical protein